jgi:hypothetical protein
LLKGAFDDLLEQISTGLFDIANTTVQRNNIRVIKKH